MGSCQHIQALLYLLPIPGGERLHDNPDMPHIPLGCVGAPHSLCELTFFPHTSVSTLTGAIAVTARPSSVLMTDDSANLGHPWLKFAVQHPKWGSSPKVWASPPLKLKGAFPSGILVHST